MALSTYQDFFQLTVKQLKHYLAVRGLNQDERHAELVARAFVAMEIKMTIVASEEDQKLQLEKDYSDKITHLDVADPSSLINLATNDLTKWPNLDTGHIFSYILKNRDFNDTDYIGKYKDQKAYSYFDSGFVGPVLCYEYEDYKPTSRKIVLLFANVRASFNINTEKSLWIAIDKQDPENPEILSADCTCMAGASEGCNHAIAALYKVEYANNKGLTLLTCTEKACQWNSTRKEIEPRRVCDIFARKKLASNQSESKTAKQNQSAQSDTSREEFQIKALNSFDPRKDFHREIQDLQVDSFFKNVGKVKKSAVLFQSLDKTESEVDIKNCTVDNCVSRTLEHHFGDKDSLVPSFIANLSMTKETISKIETATVGQSENQVWFDMRKGRLAASKHHDYFTKINTIDKGHNKDGIKTTSLVSEIVYGKEKIKISALEYGVKNEENALKSFYAAQVKAHPNLKIEKAGLFIHKAKPFIAASPDGIMTCKCRNIKRTIEIKCPKTLEGMEINSSTAKKCLFLKVTKDEIKPVSYTHLTLPTIYSV